MCQEPNIIDGMEVSCRECNECIATYKNTWVARCVAEKQTLPHAYAITLTYADVSGEPPLGARVYRYKDVSNMWKRIRSAGKRKWKQNIEFRYVVVGEKGTKFGRCHYHGVVFSSHPIQELGTMRGAKSDGFAFKRRLDWSIWPHGFVEFQMADRKGMAYCLKYILKSRMTAKRSKEKGREGKTEWLASSYLWCSKVPPIGAVWLESKLNQMIDVGTCPSSLRIAVPGGGEWYIAGEAQKQMCIKLHHANNQYRRAMGRDLAGWRTLLRSVEEQIENQETGELVDRKPKEWLENGEEEEEERREEDWYEQNQRFTAFRDQFEREQENRSKITEAQRIVNQCGNIRPCAHCAKGLNRYNNVDIEQEYAFQKEAWIRELNPKHWAGRQSEEDFQRWWRSRLRPSRACGARTHPETIQAFERLVPLYKAEAYQRGREAIGKALQTKAGQREGSEG